MKKFLVAGLALLLGGCASIIAGDQQRIAVVTPEVKDAACKLEDGRGGFWYLPRTPGTVIVNKGDGPLEVTCEKEGYKTATATVKNHCLPSKKPRFRPTTRSVPIMASSKVKAF